METLQFHCPACRTLLRVPIAVAGTQGPCPACGREIIAPIPDRGLEARLAPEDTFAPFPGSAPPETSPAQPEPEPETPTEEPHDQTTPASPEPEPPTEELLEQATPTPSEAAPPPADPAPTEEPFVPFSDPPEAEEPSEPVASPQEPDTIRTDSSSRKEAVAEQAECLAPKHYRRLRTAILVLSCLLCSLISFVAGYLTAQKAQIIPAPIFANTPAHIPTPIVPTEDPAPPQPPVSEEPDTPEEPPDAADPVEPVPSTDPADPAEDDHSPEEIGLEGNPSEPLPRPAARATLDAFLSAPDWSSRIAYVLDPDKVQAAMKSEAEAGGDGPIEAISITPSHVFADQEHFEVKTEAIPAGFPVTLQRSDNDWRIDWTIFHEFRSDAFRKFASGKGGEVTELHLYLKPHPAEDPNGFARYQLSAPIEGRSYPAFAKRGRLAQAKITALLESEAVKENEALQALLAKEGIPLVVKLSYQSRGENQNFLLIEDLVAQGWGR